MNDKQRLFRVLLRALKVRGQILITDYCAPPPPGSANFSTCVAQRGYDLHDVDGYARLLRAAGFDDVDAQDLSDDFRHIHEMELARLPDPRLGAVDRTAMQCSWCSKLQRIVDGEPRWGMLRARRSL